MKKIFIVIVSVLFFSVTAHAQFSEIVNKSQVHGSFEADGMYYLPDNAMGFSDSVINGRNFAFNSFARITYSLGNFSAGFRYEAYLPPAFGYDPRLDGNGFPYLWASYTTGKFSFTVGSFYEQFGNGLTLRSYEEWTLGYDNAINGIKVQYEPVSGLIIKGVYGVQRFFWNKYSNNNRGIVKGADLELCFNDLFAAMQDSKIRLTLGGSAVSKYQIDNNPSYKLPRNVGNFAGRFNLGIGRFNFSSEYAYKINDPSAINNYIYKPGESFLFSASYSRKGLGIYAQFKRTDNFSFKSDRGEIENALDINFLPPIIEPHTYMLASMYPYGTQPNGEIGFQFQIDYKIPKKSKLGGKYGWGIHVNYSQINDIVRNQVNDTTPIGQNGTLGYTSPFFSFGDRVFYRDLTFEVDKKFTKKFKSIFKYIYQDFDIDKIQGEPQRGPVIGSNIGIVDMTYKFTSKKALRWEVQGLFTKEDKQNWLAGLLEYTISPHWFFSVSDQWNYNNHEINERLHFFSGSLGYTHKTTRFEMTYGRTREGVVCVGGVCRQRPASSGFSFTISSSF